MNIILLRKKHKVQFAFQYFCNVCICLFWYDHLDTYHLWLGMSLPYDVQRDITPPPTKRRRISSPPKAKTTAPQVSENISMAGDEVTKTASAPTFDSDLSTIRIYSWNINGITPFIQQQITRFFTKSKPTIDSNESGTGKDVDKDSARDTRPPHRFQVQNTGASLRGFLRRHRWPHLLFLQEVKINANDNGTKRAVQIAVNEGSIHQDTEPTYSVFFSLPKDKHNVRGFGGKMYGVASIVRDDFLKLHVDRVREVEWDIEGRVSVVELKKAKMAIFNIYAVNGTDKPYRSPRNGKVIGTRHDRKLAFHKLLLEECQKFETSGWVVVAAGDFNVARERIDGHPNLRMSPYQHVLNRADFNSKFFEDESGLQAIDAFRYKRGRVRRYTYHPRGREWGSSCDRVDYVIVSKGIIEAKKLIAADIMDSVQERGPSDHVPVMVEIGLDFRD
jgi:exonuclease III